MAEIIGVEPTQECNRDVDEDPKRALERIKNTSEGFLSHTCQTVHEFLDHTLTHAASEDERKMKATVRRFLREKLQNIRLGRASPEDSLVLDTCFVLLDTLLCKQRLNKLGRDRASFKFIPMDHESWNNKDLHPTGTAGGTFLSTLDGSTVAEPRNTKVDILIFEIKDSDVEWRFIHYVGTIAHEITHAFDTLYACQCPTCCNEVDSVNISHAKTGHGYYWSKTAKLMEDFIKRELKLKVDLCRTQVLALEMMDGYRPGVRDFNELELDCICMAEELGKSEDAAIKEFARDLGLGNNGFARVPRFDALLGDPSLNGPGYETDDPDLPSEDVDEDPEEDDEDPEEDDEDSEEDDEDSEEDDEDSEEDDEDSEGHNEAAE